MKKNEVFGTSFCKSVLQMFDYSTKAKLSENNSSKNLHYSFYWDAVGYKFNIMNIWHELAGNLM